MKIPYVIVDYSLTFGHERPLEVAASMVSTIPVEVEYGFKLIDS